MSAVVDKQLVKELENRDARRRKKAIERLGATNEPAAIKLLMAVSRQDADAGLRELALKMAQTLNPQMVEAIIAEKTQPKKPSAILTPAEQESKRRAKASAEEAMNYHGKGNTEEALKWLSKALLIYPPMREDGYFLNILQAITGEEGETALQLLPQVKKSFLDKLFGQ
jgi:hypothetical protein